MESYEIVEVKEDGTSVMRVRGVDFTISPKSLPDDEWELQAKARLFADTISE